MRRQEEPKHLRALIYTRVSKQEMTNPEFCSLDGQEDRCRDLARAHGWKVVGVFRDASTGGNTDRPSLKELLERVAAGDCDRVICYKLDRLSRSVAGFWNLVNTLGEHECNVVSVTESFDSGTATGRLMMGILSNFAQFERETIVERTKQGLGSRARAGYWPIRHTPFGFDRKSNGDGAPTTLVPNDDAKWVRAAFRRYLDGDGPSVIADWLNEEGVLAPEDRRWDGRRVRRMLGHVAYIGRVPWNGTDYEGKHPPIVNSDLWATVQERLARGQRGQCKKLRTVARGEYAPALVGRVRDPSGEPFKRYWSKGRNGKLNYYYQDPASGTNLNAEAFDQEILRGLRVTISGPTAFATTLAKAREENGRRRTELEERVQRLKEQAAALELQEGRLVDAIASGVAVERIKAKLDEVAEAKRKVAADLAECDTERAAIDQACEDVDMFAELRDFFEAVDEKSKFVSVQNVLRGVVDYITLDIPANRLYVSLNLPYSGAESIRENGQKGTATWENAPNVAVSRADSVADRPKTTGEGDGTRTHNHQIDSLVL